MLLVVVVRGTDERRGTRLAATADGAVRAIAAAAAAALAGSLLAARTSACSCWDATVGSGKSHCAVWRWPGCRSLWRVEEEATKTFWVTGLGARAFVCLLRSNRLTVDPCAPRWLMMIRVPAVVCVWSDGGRETAFVFFSG